MYKHGQLLIIRLLRANSCIKLFCLWRLTLMLQPALYFRMQKLGRKLDITRVPETKISFVIEGPLFDYVLEDYTISSVFQWSLFLLLFFPPLHCVSLASCCRLHTFEFSEREQLFRCETFKRSGHHTYEASSFCNDKCKSGDKQVNKLLINVSTSQDCSQNIFPGGGVGSTIVFVYACIYVQAKLKHFGTPCQLLSYLHNGHCGIMVCKCITISLNHAWFAYRCRRYSTIL